VSADPRFVALVNGVPGAGKTTLALQLAAELEWPLLSRDLIKETLFDTLGIADRAWSRVVGAAAAETLWTVLTHLPHSAIVESVFSPAQRQLTQAGLARAGVMAVAEVVCDCPAEEAERRFWDRVAVGERHPGHAQPGPDHLDEADRLAWEQLTAEPITVGLGPSLLVDTTRPVDVGSVAAWLRAQETAAINGASSG
jgi:glucokinase